MGCLLATRVPRCTVERAYPRRGSELGSECPLAAQAGCPWLQRLHPWPPAEALQAQQTWQPLLRPVQPPWACCRLRDDSDMSPSRCKSMWRPEPCASRSPRMDHSGIVAVWL